LKKYAERRRGHAFAPLLRQTINTHVPVSYNDILGMHRFRSRFDIASPIADQYICPSYQSVAAI
jgi:hypothetical protein